jgi:hypothetical protein
MTLDELQQAAGQDGDPNRAMDDLVADFARRNPRLAWLPQMMAMRRQAVVEPADDGRMDAALARIAELEEALDASEARARRYAAACERLTARLEESCDRLADAAAAVGACGLCWGEDPRCRSCRGRGRPGGFAIDPALRRRFFAEQVPQDAGVTSPRNQ